jgi:hypothetical protein
VFENRVLRRIFGPKRDEVTDLVAVLCRCSRFSIIVIVIRK